MKPLCLYLIGLCFPLVSYSEEASQLIQKLESGERQTLVYYGTSLSRQTWTELTTKTLKRRYGDLIKVFNGASGGKDSVWGLANFEAQVLTHQPDTVTIEFSMNDAIASREISVDRARQNLVTMIKRLREQNPQVEIILMTMNPQAEWARSAGNRPEVPTYYEMVRSVAAAEKTRLVDLNRVWMKLINGDQEKFGAYSGDGVHILGKGHREVILPTLLDSLGFPEN